ncbi:hypothetical protein ABBQ32_008398 [Trebouxia sp. C0010 RCD-2024]
MMDNCYAAYCAVSQAIGLRCQQFSAAKEPELAASYAMYQQALPAGHVKPTRPTWLKPNQHFANLAKKKLNSWSSLVLWAGTVTDKTATDLLPRYSSLKMPPVAVMNYVEALVASLKADVGPLPVTDDSLRSQAELLLRQAEVPNLPTFSTKGDNGEARFTQDADKWWRQCTGAPAFCNFIQKAGTPVHNQKKFAHRVSTDGYSASVTPRRLLRQPVSAAPSRPRKRRRGTSDAADCVDPNKQWVRGIDADAIRQAASCEYPQEQGHLVALDPGRRSIFTTVVHDPHGDSQQHLQDPQPAPLDKYFSLSWSNKRWHDVSGNNESKAKSKHWLQEAPAVQAALLSTPSPKTTSVQAFGQHIQHRLQHANAVLSHLLTPRHRKLRRKRKMRYQ